MLVDVLMNSDGGDPPSWFCGYCHELVAGMDRDNGPRLYHCATCEAEGKGINPEAQVTLKPCGHIFRVAGEKGFVMNP